jgi:hypothetical protein
MKLWMKAAAWCLATACAASEPATPASGPKNEASVCDPKTCNQDRFCRFPPGSCGEDDRAAVCTARPEACTMQFDPVCGCDGQTHSNACRADGAGVSIRHEGPCETG